MELEPAPDYLTDMLSHFGTLTAKQLQNLTIHGLPALHYLATFPFKPEDHVKLDQLIKLFKYAECDLNQKINNYFAGGTRASFGFTPLLVAIDQHNLTFVKCLLQNGAKVDIHDNQGFSPLHWAVFVDDLECFRVLIHAGAQWAFSHEEISIDIHQILLTAVDEGRTEMVNYLLEKGLVHLNQKADYTDPLLPDLHQTSMIFTPLARAVRKRRQPIIETLLQHGAKVSGFSELHHCILHGEVEIGCMLIDQFSLQDLANDKIDDKWALLCLSESAFRDSSIHKTIELIGAYLAAGWDLNSFGKLSKNIWKIGNFILFPYTEFSLLHLACYFGSHELVKYLLKMGADLNLKTRGNAILNPLQVSILQENWSSVEYLVANGADIGAVGGFQTIELAELEAPQRWLSEPHSRDFDFEFHFTSIDLLLQLGKEEGLTALEQMLKKGVPPPEKIAFLRAVFGRNYNFVCKVVEQLCGVQKVKMQDLSWLPTRRGRHFNARYVPSLYWCIQDVRNRHCTDSDVRDNLVKVVDVMGRYGYDVSIADRFAKVTYEEPLIFSALKIEELNRCLSTVDLPLLGAILKFDKVRLNVRNSEGLNPVEYVIHEWTCLYRSKKVPTAVRLLIRGGVDVPGMTIGDGFKYYRGYLPMMQLLCSTGATIQPELFVPTVAYEDREHLAIGIVRLEIEELKKWKEKFDKESKFKLKHLCVLKTRKMLKLETIGDWRKLDGEVPGNVKEDLMGQIMNFD